MRWRQQVAAQRKPAFKDQQYWGRPVPGFGDPAASLVLLGLAPAAHGANRTGRMFTGDRSGDFLYAALSRAGLANMPTSVSAHDQLQLRGVWVTAAVRCAPPANKPTSEERDNCLPWTLRELALLHNARVLLCLGAFAWDAGLRLRSSIEADAKRDRFSHRVVSPGRALTLVGCYHPSQQNTFTRRLTEEMIDEVLAIAVQLAADLTSASPPARRAPR